MGPLVDLGAICDTDGMEKVSVEVASRPKRLGANHMSVFLYPYPNKSLLLQLRQKTNWL